MTNTTAPSPEILTDAEIADLQGTHQSCLPDLVAQLLATIQHWKSRAEEAERTVASQKTFLDLADAEIGELKRATAPAREGQS